MIASLKLAMYALALISFDLMDLHTSIPQLRRSAKTAVFRPRVAAMLPLAVFGRWQMTASTVGSGGEFLVALLRPGCFLRDTNQ